LGAEALVLETPPSASMFLHSLQFFEISALTTKKLEKQITQPHTMFIRNIYKSFRTEEEEAKYVREAFWKFCTFVGVSIIFTLVGSHLAKKAAIVPTPARALIMGKQ